MTEKNFDNPLSTTVVIPAYNMEKLLRRAIDSVLEQTQLPEEIIVVDDGSTDNTANIAKEYANSIKYVYQENAGLSGARNAGIKLAKGNWIAFLDSDDQWLPNKHKTQIDILKANPELKWICSNFMRCFCDETPNEPARKIEVAKKILGQKTVVNYYDIYTQGLWAWVGTVMVQKDVFDTAGLFDPKYFPGPEETDMWNRVAILFPKVAYCTEPLVIYHQGRPDSASAGPFKLHLISMMIEELLVFAENHGQKERFLPGAARLVYDAILMLQREERNADIIATIKQFSYLLKTAYKYEMYLRAKFPRTAPTLFKYYHKLKRIFKR